MKKLLLLVPTLFFCSYLIVHFGIKLELPDNYEGEMIINPTNQMVRVKREKKNRIDTVDLETYVMGVISAEMPISFELEALKAQAVCARTYVLRKIEQNKDKEYDVVDTVANQVYQDIDDLKKKWKTKFDQNYQKVQKISQETNGLYMTYQGKIIETFFFSTSNGHTENSEEVFTKALPYLRSVESTWDEKVSPVFKTELEMSLHDFYTKLNMPYQKKLKIEIIEKTEAGSIKTLKVNDVKWKGTEFRTKLGLRSTYFTYQINDNNISFKMQGYGHGVGMSQYGAQGMAKEGYHYEQILKYYYQGIEIQKK